MPEAIRAALLAVVATLSGCTCGSGAGGGAPSASSVGSAASSAPKGEDERKPVYPTTGVAPDPIAQKLCAALHEMPVQRKASCCSTTAGANVASECTRVVSFAIQSKAIAIEPAAADACVDALQKVYAGCDWVGPTRVPLPSVCDGIVRGTLDEGARCRSSLDCTGNLRCHAAGPTTMGVCGPPLDRGKCGDSSDTLASFLRQESTDAKHPECSGYCAWRDCADLVAPGGACKQSDSCGKDGRCDDGRCVTSPLPGPGKPCSVGRCAEGARCVKNQCAEPKPGGAPCESDPECRGGCLRGDAGPGKCGPKCILH